MWYFQVRRQFQQFGTAIGPNVVKVADDGISKFSATWAYGEDLWRFLAGFCFGADTNNIAGRVTCRKGNISASKKDSLVTWRQITSTREEHVEIRRGDCLIVWMQIRYETEYGNTLALF